MNVIKNHKVIRRSEENQLKMFQTRIVCSNFQKIELFILWKVHCFYGTWHNLIRSMKAVKVSYEQNHHHSYWRNFQKTQQPLKNDLWRTTFGEIQPKSKLNRRDTRKQKLIQFHFWKVFCLLLILLHVKVIKVLDISPVLISVQLWPQSSSSISLENLS